MVQRGRSLRGEKSPTRKLDEASVFEIREMLSGGNSHQYIADKFKISRAAVHAIESGRNWGWLKTKETA
jgi:hypothetical protein